MHAAVKVGPGSTVQLSAGTFYTSTIFVKNFKGCFKGAGKGKTVIDTVPGVPVDTMPSVEPFPFLIGFSGGNVRLSNMSFNITSMTPAESWYDMWGDGPLTSLGAIVLATGSASTNVDQVGFTAAPIDQEDDFNVWFELGITGAQQWHTGPTYPFDDSYPLALAPTGGIDSVSRCSFTGGIGIFADGLTAGSLTVGGSAARQNVFNVIFGCTLFDASNSTSIVSHNLMQVTDGNGVQLYQSWFNPFQRRRPCPLPTTSSATTTSRPPGTGAA